MTTGTTKKTLTPEQLERLKVAREKALEVRKKMAAVRKAKKDLEKVEREKELEEKYKAVVEKAKDSGKAIPKPRVKTPSKPVEQIEAPQPIEEPLPPKATKPKPKKKPAKKVLYMDSEDSSSSGSESEYDISPIKEKYREKYKAKYRQAQQPPPQNSRDFMNDAYTIAKHNIMNKVSDDVKRLAYSSLFG